jgi:hypothetical protein
MRHLLCAVLMLLAPAVASAHNNRVPGGDLQSTVPKVIPAPLIFKDDVKICLGNDCDWWLIYNSSTTQFEIWHIECGAGPCPVQVCDDGGDDCTFTGLWTVAGGIASTSETQGIRFGSTPTDKFEVLYDGTVSRIETPQSGENSGLCIGLGEVCASSATPGNGLFVDFGDVSAISYNGYNPIAVFQDNLDGRGIGIAGGNNTWSGLFFSYPADDAHGFIRYYGPSDSPAATMAIGTASGERIRIDSNSMDFQQATTISTTNNDLTIDPAGDLVELPDSTVTTTYGARNGFTGTCGAQAEQVLTFAADPGDASKTTSGLVPLGATSMVITAYTVVAGTNCTSADYGDPTGGVNDYGDAISVSAGATVTPADYKANLNYNTISGEEVIITANGGNCFDLSVRIVAYYCTWTAPTN